MERISISEISVESDGNYKVYYDDDNMFLEHEIVIEGNIETKIFWKACGRCGIMILLAQNPSQLALSCRHFVSHYTGNPWLVIQ